MYRHAVHHAQRNRQPQQQAQRGSPDAKYERLQLVGKGSFGQVFLVRQRSTGSKYVMKVVSLVGMQPTDRVEAQREASMLQRLDHPNIIRYFESFESPSALRIIMEYASRGDLHAFIKGRAGKRIPELQILDLFLQICLGMKYLHERHILHRDIKTSNIFLNDKGVVKIGDFGISKVLSHTMQCAKTAVGTPYYMSPEICQSRPYNNRSDVWAMGCVLYELATLKHAFEANSMKALVAEILRARYKPLAAAYSDDLKGLVAVCLDRSPANRPSVQGLLQNPVLKGRIQAFLAGQTESVFAKPKAAQPPPGGPRYVVSKQRYVVQKPDAAPPAAQSPAHRRRFQAGGNNNHNNHNNGQRQQRPAPAPSAPPAPDGLGVVGVREVPRRNPKPAGGVGRAGGSPSPQRGGRNDNRGRREVDRRGRIVAGGGGGGAQPDPADRARLRAIEARKIQQQPQQQERQHPAPQPAAAGSAAPQQQPPHRLPPAAAAANASGGDAVPLGGVPLPPLQKYSDVVAHQPSSTQGLHPGGNVYSHVDANPARVHPQAFANPHVFVRTPEQHRVENPDVGLGLPLRSSGGGALSPLSSRLSASSCSGGLSSACDDHSSQCSPQVEQGGAAPTPAPVRAAGHRPQVLPPLGHVTRDGVAPGKNGLVLKACDIDVMGASRTKRAVRNVFDEFEEQEAEEAMLADYGDAGVEDEEDAELTDTMRAALRSGGGEDEFFNEKPCEGGEGEPFLLRRVPATQAELNSKFLLDGATFRLPNLDNDASLSYRVEVLRQHLDDLLGTSHLVQAYSLLRDAPEGEEEGDSAIERARNALGSLRAQYLPLVMQLIVCEDILDASN